MLTGLVGDDVEAFATDVRDQWAVEIGLIRIGEAVHHLPDSVVAAFPDQPWRDIVAIRGPRPHEQLAAHLYAARGPEAPWSA